MDTAAVLDREIYTEAEAARLLRVSQSTLNYWLEGGRRRGTFYEPVIRLKPRGNHPAVTWAEFIEAGLLRAYRRDAGVPMRELRAFIDQLRREFAVPYPLAHERPFALRNGQLVFDAQKAARLDSYFWIVSEAGGQTSLLPRAQAFYQRIGWEDGVAVSWRPVDDPRSSVIIDPERRFGKPTVSGVSTHILWEQIDVGEEVEDVADGFDVSVDDVGWAVEYEESLRHRPGAAA